MGSGAQSYMRKGFLICEELRKFFPIYEDTVTRIDVIFRYPDRVPLTHFVHGAKKIFSL